VAASAASARLDAAVEPSAPLRAPDEISHVAESFRESVAQMRAQHSRNLLLTAGLAHELRSPLQNLISEAEVALMRPRDVDAYRKLVGGQLEELRALALVVDNLITLTALRDTQALPRHEPFDLATQIAMRLSHEEHEGARRGVVVDVLHHGDCTIDGDREALVLMLRNLVGNAVRWTSDDTAVVLTIDGRADDLVVTVDDHGPGVPPSEREAIFEAFYQGPSPDGARAGYGLGLALARTAARSQGGEIRVETADTGGARFHVRLPRRGARARIVVTDPR
jgi:two-component system heavy metal sensor histidine kinase CusS